MTYRASCEKLTKFKNIWEQYKETNKCTDCGLSMSSVIQADHRKELGTKRRKCSDYIYWAQFSVEEYKNEMKICEPRCRFCHHVNTNRELFQKKSVMTDRDLFHKNKKKQLVLDEKLFRGECAICKRKVTPYNSTAFIFDHGQNRHRRNFGVSRYTNSNNCSYEAAEEKIIQEMLLCRLLCANCDWVQTKEELWGEEKDPVEQFKKSYFFIT